MRNFDFSPFYRSTVGFDRIFDLVDSGVASDWPPYNIEKIGADRYSIIMAVAGFSPSEIDLTQTGDTLVVKGHKEPAKGGEMLHQGLPLRSFKQSFRLEDHVRVTGASLENGLLAIELVREVPEQLKPRRIEIGVASGDRSIELGAVQRRESANKAA
jgi:molecular chaperone IbpA